MGNSIPSIIRLVEIDDVLFENHHSLFSIIFLNIVSFNTHNIVLSIMILHSDSNIISRKPRNQHQLHLQDLNERENIKII